MTGGVMKKVLCLSHQVKPLTAVQKGNVQGFYRDHTLLTCSLLSFATHPRNAEVGGPSS